MTLSFLGHPDRLKEQIIISILSIHVTVLYFLFVNKGKLKQNVRSSLGRALIEVLGVSPTYAEGRRIIALVYFCIGCVMY